MCHTSYVALLASMCVKQNKQQAMTIEEVPPDFCMLIFKGPVCKFWLVILFIILFYYKVFLPINTLLVVQKTIG